VLDFFFSFRNIGETIQWLGRKKEQDAEIGQKQDYGSLGAVVCASTPKNALWSVP
jgi:hypothetical protein